MPRKRRADQLLVDQGLCQSRSAAQRLIMAGQVRDADEHVIQKPSTTLSSDTPLYVVERSPYVSRGAYKLKPALDIFLPSLPPDTVALDIGASTGGFTDLLLQRGAKRVYAVDSGYGQLDFKLRRDSRVVCLEKVNARYLNAEQIPEVVSIITVDVSFISVRKVLPAAAQFLAAGGWCFVLVKPQFEAARPEVESGGVVRDEHVHERCVREVREFGETELHWTAQGVESSPLTGPKGNKEFVVVFRS